MIYLLILILLAGCSHPQKAPYSFWWPERILTAEERHQESREKISRVTAFLKRERLSEIPITTPEGLAWITAGAEDASPILVHEDGTISPYSPAAAPIRYWSERLAELRVPLTAGEILEYRWLGQRCAEAVEEVCRQIPAGMNERAIEALISDGLMRHAIHPASIRLASDDRIRDSGVAAPDDERKAERALLVSVCGRRWGIHVALTRMIYFGPLPDDIQKDAEAAAAANAEMWARMVPGAEWQATAEGGPIGYRIRDWDAAGARNGTIVSGQAFAWSPSVRGIRTGDTVLIEGDNFVVLTRTPDWPVIESRARGRLYRLPAILVR